MISIQLIWMLRQKLEVIVSFFLIEFNSPLGKHETSLIKINRKKTLVDREQALPRSDSSAAAAAAATAAAAAAVLDALEDDVAEVGTEDVDAATAADVAAATAAAAVAAIDASLRAGSLELVILSGLQ